MLAPLLGLSLPTAEDAAAALGPERRRQQTLETLVALILELAARHPVLLIVEDLHWVDPSTLECLGLLLDQAPTVRLLALFTARPDFRPPWASRDERMYEAEIHRMRGELLLLHERRDEAEECLHRALEVSRRQQGKSLELRAAMSLGHLWRHRGRPEDARRLLAEVHGWFTEGFDTADLRDARALLTAWA